MTTNLVDPADFPASRKSTYLNTAAVALMYRGAEVATTKWFSELAEKGTITFDEVAEAAVFDHLHTVVASLFNANAEHIAVGSSATELLASLAWAVAPTHRENVVSTEMAFPSTTYPWARVARHTGCEIRLAPARDDYVDPDELIELIDAATRVVCLSDVEYSTGQRYDISRLASVAHEHDALLVVDATQSAGAIPMDVAECGVDAVVAAGYKWLCAPLGVAVMYVEPGLADDLDPGVIGFRSHKEMWNLDANRLELPKSARRFEFSTMAYGCAIGLTRSIEYLLEIGIERIFDYNLKLADHLIEGLRTRGANVVSPDASAERTSIVAARIRGASADRVAAHLKRANVEVSARRDVVRFSPHLYNVPADIEKALKEIDTLVGGNR